MNGDPAVSITSRGLIVREDSKPVSGVDLEPESEPQSVCVLVDTSGSIYVRLPIARKAAERFVEQLPVDDEVCVAHFWAGYPSDTNFDGGSPGR